MSLFKDESPLLSSSAAIDEKAGIEIQLGAKIIGKWNLDLQYAQFGAAVPTAASGRVWIAPYPTEVIDVQVMFAVGSTSGTLQVTHDLTATAPGAGTAILSSTINLATTGTANTVFSALRNAYTGSAAGTSILATAPGTLQLATGDSLSLTFGGTLTSLVGLTVSIILKRI
jgi:hypothetical protein